jgi:hypothetical protein
MTTATQRFTRSEDLANRLIVIATAVAGVLAFNLLIYVMGLAFGGASTYVQSGKATRVDALAVTLLTVGPLTTGLTLVTWLSRKWPVLIATSKVIGPLLAVATIGMMTIPAHFDTTSTIILATMHIALIPATLLALARQS